MDFAVIAKPDNLDPSWKANKWWEYDKWMTKYRKYADCVELLEENIKKAYALIYGSQCSPALKTTLQVTNGWKTMDQEHDAIQLLHSIRRIHCKVNDATQSSYSLSNSRSTYTSIFKNGTNQMTNTSRNLRLWQMLSSLMENPMGQNLWCLRRYWRSRELRVLIWMMHSLNSGTRCLESQRIGNFCYSSSAMLSGTGTEDWGMIWQINT